MSFLAVVPSVHEPWTKACVESMRAFPAGTVMVVDNSIRNRGVAASWNMGVREVLDRRLDWLVLVSAAVRFEEPWGADLIGALAAHTGALAVEGAWGLGWHCVAFGRAAFETVGLFDENFWPAYCLAPETLVLRADLRWVQIGTLEPGDALVGVDEIAPAFGVGRSYRPAEVIATARRLAECVRVTMDDGRQVVCTTDHRWLSKAPRPTNTPYTWRPISRLRPGYRIYSPLDTWATASSFDAGWLAGIYDGEGHLHISDRLRGVVFTQRPGAVLDRAKGILTSLGIPFTWRYRDEDGVVRVEVNARRHVMRLLGSLRPVRLLQQRVWEGTQLRSRSYPSDLPIADIEYVGPTEVVDISTTTRTFLAEGMVSHNCEDLDFSRRLMLAGLTAHTDRDFWPKVTVEAYVRGFAHGQRFGGAQHRGSGEDMLSYYERKWGGRPGGETYDRPFGCKQLDWWPPEGDAWATPRR